MSITEREIQHHLDKLFNKTREIPLKKKDKYIIFSDTHAGNRKSRDDFKKTGEMFIRVLLDYYLPRGYTLILNGDIEELQKWRLGVIQERWSDFFEAIGQFQKEDRLIKLIGNHDLELQAHRKEGVNRDLQESLRLNYNGHTIFILHGHQASGLFTKYNWFVGGVLKYLAAPLHIKNRSAAHDSKRRYQVEKRLYKFSSEKRILSIIGHTHRPLFESHSKRDSLRFDIEALVRDYPNLPKRKQKEAITKIEALKTDLINLSKRERKGFKTPSFYNQNILLPCLFNSGSAIGRRGMTGIELTGSDISLVHWFDRSKKIKPYWESGPMFHLENTNYRKRVINQDYLDYIFNRIKLLTSENGAV